MALWSRGLAWVAAAWLIVIAALQSQGVGLAFGAWAKLGVSALAWSCVPVALLAACGAPQLASRRAAALWLSRGYCEKRVSSRAHWALLPWTVRRIARGAGLLIVLGGLLVDPGVAPLRLLRLVGGTAGYAAGLGVFLSVAAGLGHRAAGRRGGWVLLGAALVLELGLWLGFDATLVGLASTLLNACLGLN